MSELQAGLLAIGAVIVVAVLAYNKWQEIRYRRISEQQFGPGHEDVLLRPGHASDDDKLPLDTVAHDEENQRIEPSLLQESTAAEVAAVAGLAEITETVIDEAIDYVIGLRADGEVIGALVIESAVKCLTGFTKPVNLEGFDEARGCWAPLTHAHQRKLLRVGVQLVDRHGMLLPLEMERFSKAVDELAALVGARTDESEPAEASRRALLLDQFCGDVDIQIALNVVPSEALFSGTKIRALAESAGFSLESDGRFRRRDDQGIELFLLANAGNTPFGNSALHELETAGVMFEIDVPRVAGGVVSFNQLARIAGQFASTLGGRLVDDNRADLGPASLAAIGKQLESIYASMSDRGIPAGGSRALRLFS